MTNHPRRRRPARRASGPAIWRGHRGDGDVAIAVAYAKNSSHKEEAMQQSHDFVIEQTGPLRAGPVQWLVFDREEGVQRLVELAFDLTTEEVEYLDACGPDALVVIAVAATDAPADVRTMPAAVDL